VTVGEQHSVDGPDRLTAAGYAAVVGLLFAPAAVLVTHPRLAGPQPWWQVMATAAVCAALNAVLPLRRDQAGAREKVTAGVYAAFWLAPAAWIAWAQCHDVWHHAGRFWLTGACMTAAAVVAAYVFAMPTNLGLDMGTNPAAPAQPAAAGAVAGAEAEWQARLADPRIGKAPGVTVDTVDDWPTRTGYDVTGECPDGITWDDLKKREPKITGSLKLGPGCSAEVWPGAHSGAYRISVTTVDSLAQPRTYADTGELSGNGLIPVGWYRNSLDTAIPVREACTLCVSGTGGGKSNWLHDLTAGFVRCPDVLLWQIDIGGAGIVVPWADPYLTGRVDRPVVDWPAPNLAEALTMTEVALQVIAHRRIAYTRLMLDANTDLLPISAALPMIRIVIDETAEAAGASADPRLTSNIVRIIQLGRAVAVRVDLSALRAVATVLPTDAQQQIGTRALFAVNDEAEIGRALGWRTGLRLDEIQHLGGGRIRIGASGSIDAFRTFHAALPQTIARVAADCAARRPGRLAGGRWVGLDEGSLSGVSPDLRAAYVSRWDRLAPVLTGGSAGSPPPPPGPAHRAGSPGGPGGSIADVVARVQQATERAKRHFADNRLRSMPAEVADARFAELAAGWDQAPADPAPAAGGADLPADNEAATLAVLRRFGPAGASGTAVHAALADAGRQVSLSRVYDYLNAAAHRPRHGVYVHPDLRSDQ
jgi:hypothetical protein